MRFFFDRPFFAFAALRFLQLGFFLCFAAFFGGFGRRFRRFCVLAFVVFGFELSDDPTQRTLRRALRCRGRAFRRFDFFAAAAAAGERRGG